MPTQRFSLFAHNTDGIDFSADPQTWTIAPRVTVSSILADGIASNFKNNVLINLGKIISRSEDGVLYQSDDGTITNQVGGSIIGRKAGIDIERGNTDTIDNLGHIVSANVGVLFDAQSNFGSTLINRGSISGQETGVASDSTLAGCTIINYGTIRSDHDGIVINPHNGLAYDNPSIETIITNESTGVIESSSGAAIVKDNGGTILHNYGRIDGGVSFSGSGVDKIFNDGTITGWVSLDSTSGYFNGARGLENAIEAGGGSYRIITGREPAFILIGEGGQETITAGIGGAVFAFDFSPGSEVVDINNFKHGLDIFNLQRAEFPGFRALSSLTGIIRPSEFHVGTQAIKPWATIVYDPHDGYLLYDPDGTGPAAAIHFATVSPHVSMSNTDFIVTG